MGPIWIVLGIILGSILIAGAVFLYFLLGGLGYNALQFGSVELDYRAVSLQALYVPGGDKPLYDQVGLGPSCLGAQVDDYVDNQIELPRCAALAVESLPRSCGGVAISTIVPREGPYPDKVLTTIATREDDLDRVATFLDRYSLAQAKELGGHLGRSVVAPKQISTRNCEGYGLIFISQGADDIFEARKAD